MQQGVLLYVEVCLETHAFVVQLPTKRFLIVHMDTAGATFPLIVRWGKVCVLGYSSPTVPHSARFAKRREV